MRLHGDARAPNVRRVQIYLAEKAIEIPLSSVDLGAGEHNAPGFLALNPAGEVPVLELEDGTALAESVAICRYLEAHYPEPALFGADPIGAARIEMWQRRIELKLVLPVQDAVRNLSPAFAGYGDGPDGAQSDLIADRGRRRAEWLCDWLDRELAERRYAAGDEFSVADITLLAAIDFARVAKMRLREGRSNLERWYAEVASRQSAAA